MTYTKSQQTLAAGVSMAAGGGGVVYPTAAPNYIDLDDFTGGSIPALAASISLRLVNGATGPTTAANIQIEYSTDSTNWYDYGGLLTGSTNNNADVSWGGIVLPDSARFVRITAGNNTGQAVTLYAQIDALYDA